MTCPTCKHMIHALTPEGQATGVYMVTRPDGTLAPCPDCTKAPDMRLVGVEAFKALLYPCDLGPSEPSEWAEAAAETRRPTSLKSRPGSEEIP